MPFESVACDQSNESYRAVLSVCYAVQGGSKFWVCGWNPNESYWEYFQVVLFVLTILQNEIQDFSSVLN